VTSPCPKMLIRRAAVVVLPAPKMLTSALRIMAIPQGITKGAQFDTRFHIFPLPAANWHLHIMDSAVNSLFSLPPLWGRVGVGGSVD